jgi:hypothetical protein
VQFGFQFFQLRLELFERGLVHGAMGALAVNFRQA